MMRTIHKIIFAVSLFALLASGCTNEAMREFPRVTTLPASISPMEGAVFTAEISNHDEFTISECGFLVYKGIPSKSNLVGALTGVLNKSNGLFSAGIGTGIKEGDEYYFVAFAVTGSTITMGNVLSYLSEGSKAAEILDFYPDKGASKDTVLIQLSENIGGVSNFVVSFNQITARIIDFQDNGLRVVVPAGIDLESTISIKTGSAVNSSVKKFRLNAMKILDFNPKTGHTLDTITIQMGEYFEKGRVYVVHFNDLIATITNVQGDILKVIVPSGLSVKESTISVQSGDYTDYFVQKFQLSACIINSFSPAEVFPFQTVTIYGDNFHRVPEKNIVRFDNVSLLPLISSSTTELMVNIPSVLGGRECSVSVTIDNQTTVSPTTITIKGTPLIWERVADFPGGNSYKHSAFVIGNFGYVGLGTKINHSYSNKFWKYDPTLDSWNEIATFPGSTRIEAHGFSIEGNGYVGGGYSLDSPTRQALNDFYKYNPSLNQWSSVSGYPGSLLNNFTGTSVAVAEKGFLSFTYDDFYSFQPGSDTWVKMANPLYGMFHHGSMFTIDNNIYCIGGLDKSGVLNNEVWAYNTLTGIWTRKSDFPGLARRAGVGFASGDIGFFGLGANSGFNALYKDMWMYNPSTDTWIRIDDFPGSARTSSFSFVVDDFAYIGGGYQSSGELINDVYRLVISNLR